MATLSTFLNKPKPVEKVIQKDSPKSKFFIMSTYGELLDLAMHLSKNENYKVIFYVSDPTYKSIGKGIVEIADDWHEYLGQDYIWVIDGTETAKLQDWMRDIGENVVGTNEIMSEHEENRQKGQKWFKDAGFDQPESQNFKSIDDALSFLNQNKDKMWILKQNGTLPKHLNHKGKFKGSEDMVFHLEELKKSWNEAEYGSFDCDLMEVVEGLELAGSAFFNGHDWLRNQEGKVVGFLNFEFKKMGNGDIGPTTGEMGTLFLGVDEDNDIFSEMLLKPIITSKLKETNYRGVFDINCIKTKKGITALEATSRFGVPATSYEFGEGMETNVGDLLSAMARGIDTPVEVNRKWGIAQVIVAPPFPVEADIENSATSLGEKLWILKNGKPVDEFTSDQMKHIKLENFQKNDKGYMVASKGGYMLVVTGTGDSIEETRENLIEYVKNNLFLSDMWYRTDLGKRIEEKQNEFI
jgi:phosphoribosylamine-glycine ligase